MLRLARIVSRHGGRVEGGVGGEGRLLPSEGTAQEVGRTGEPGTVSFRGPAAQRRQGRTKVRAD